MSTELELKYLLPESELGHLIALIPQLGKIEKSDESTLLNAYFDTKDNWFRSHDFGLRSRLKRGRFEQTIKLAGQQHGAMQMRPEYNEPCDGVVPNLAAFPLQIWPANTNLAELQNNIIELFRTDFVRKSWLLQCADGTQVELVYDKGNILSAGAIWPIAELELELITGDAQTLFNLAKTLLAHLALRTGFLSKAARGYLLKNQSLLRLPHDSGDSLLAQIRALQQAEACYEQSQSDDALKSSSFALQAISSSLLSIASLSHLADSAKGLSSKLIDNQVVFSDKEYNQLLLLVSEYLYKTA